MTCFAQGAGGAFLIAAAIAICVAFFMAGKIYGEQVEADRKR